MKKNVNEIIGLICSYEKYRFVDHRVIAEVVRDTEKIDDAIDAEEKEAEHETLG